MRTQITAYFYRSWARLGTQKEEEISFNLMAIITFKMFMVLKES